MEPDALSTVNDGAADAVGAYAPAASLLGDATRWAVRFSERLAGAPATRKSDASPVTAADLAIQAMLVVGLRERFGPVPIVGEESAQTFRGPGGDALRGVVQELVRMARPNLSDRAIDDALDAGSGDGSSNAQWIIDPIDGTRGFLSGQQYCTCLAYAEGGTVLFGAAGCPRLPGLDNASPLPGRFVAATAGRGTWAWSGLEPRGTPARVWAAATRRDPLVACESSEVSARARRRLRFLGDTLALPIAARPMESQCKFVLVATGDADLAIRFPPRAGVAAADMVWDYAGAERMVVEAGGRMTDCLGAALRFGRGRAIEGNRGVLAAAPWVHAAALQAMPEADRRLHDEESTSA